MTTTKKHYELFKNECKKWIDRFELNNYTFSFIWENLDDRGFDSSSYEAQPNYIAKVFFDKEIDEENIAHYGILEYIKHCAKHEIIHILIARLVINSKARFIGLNEINEAEEELVRKLEHIIK